MIQIHITHYGKRKQQKECENAMEKVEIETHRLANTQRKNIPISDIPVEESVGIFCKNRVKEGNSKKR